MEFRPCIDIHNGKVKQIVGGSLKDEGNQVKENFVAEQDAAYFAEFYKKDKIRGGHIILLNPSDSSYYKETKRQALLALHTYPGGMQVGGGIHAENAKEFIAMLNKLKPATAKGTYMKSIYLSSTMSPGIKIEPKSVDEI